MNMKIFYRGCISLILAAGLAACGGGSSSSVAPTDVGKLESVSVPSAALGGSRAVNIYTPYGYNTQTKYPVLYIYHGGSGTQNSWMPTMGMQYRADQLIREGKIKPLIIVAPQMIQEGYGAGAEETFVYKDLVDYIDARYSTDARREGRYIGGLSMGGFIALRNAFAHNDVFSKVGGHSPYLYNTITNSSIENPITTAGYKDLRNLKVYLDTGVSDRFNLVPTNETLYNLLQSKGVPSENHPGPGAHDVAYWSGNIDNYLKFYAGM
ncbi:MAG: esterase family protein [Burkholderiales bacterium]|nr:esterase family protein [Burkholderiales bacterium]